MPAVRFTAPPADATPVTPVAIGDPERWIHELTAGLLADVTAQRIPKRCLRSGHVEAARWPDRCHHCGRLVDGSEDPARRGRNRSRKRSAKRATTAA